MRHSRGTKLRLIGAVGGAGALAVAAIAWGASVAIPFYQAFALNLESEGETVFDVSQPPNHYYSGAGGDQRCALGDISADDTQDLGFTPANNVRSPDGTSVDLFDGGLVLAVDDRIFEDSDQTGDLVGEQLKVGPEKLKGLRVKRTELALQTSPTLRSLIKLKNKRKHKTLRRTISLDSDVGADTDEVVEETSSGDELKTNGDRWVIFSDGDPFSDPIGTLVLYGKGKDVKKTKVANGIADQDGCVTFTIRAKVPPKSSRYLLFFTEAHNPDDAGLTLAESDTEKYDKRKPGEGALEGLKKSVRKKVLNWQLAKRK